MKKRGKKPATDPLASVPPETRQEIEQHLNALTEQVEAQRDECEQWAALKPYLEQAREAGRTLPEVLHDFVATEITMRERPVEGMLALCEALALDPVETARQLIAAGEGTVPSSVPFDATSSLPAIDAALERRLREERATVELDAFKKEHPRFAELESVIGGLLEKDIATDLPDAYAKAELLKPALSWTSVRQQEPAAQPRENMPAVQPAANRPVAAQPGKAKLSITGAPPSGSDPATRKVPATTRDAVERAFAQLGL